MDAILKKYRFGYNYAADCPIFTKFCMGMQNQAATTVESQNLEIQDVS